MKRKAVSGITLALFLTGMLTLAFNIQPARSVPTTWTVDDDGPADFNTIQEAINAASSGDTIYVYNGTYYENVVVNKTVCLVGEGSETTVIDGNRTAEAVTITANNTSLSGFTIQGSDPFIVALRLENVSNTTIANNTITNSFSGMILGFSDSSIITGNNITQNGFPSNFVNSSHNVLADNTIDGLYFLGCLNNTLANNTVGSFTISYSPSNKLRNNSIWTFGVYGNTYSHFVQNIDSSNTVNTKPIYYWINREDDEVPSDAGYVALINSTNITVGNLDLESGFQGIVLFSTKNSRIHSNNLIDINHGIWLIRSSNDTISENTIAEGMEGIRFEYSSNNIVSGNTITNNNEGIRLTKSSSNIFRHNDFIDNQKQVYLYESFDNVWDDGYPSGGNYWSDYTGVDANMDGIGDSFYEIDSNSIDHYPLMGMFSDFNATSEHHVQTVCNSSISYFRFNGTAISFNVTGETDTIGFCRICIPTALMNDTYKVFVNGTEILPSPEPLSCSNSTHNYLYFTYNHSTQEVVIVPEFPTWTSMLLILVLLTIALAICKRRLPKTLIH